jgi:hypothetical protein
MAHADDSFSKAPEAERDERGQHDKAQEYHKQTDQPERSDDDERQLQSTTGGCSRCCHAWE